MKSPNWFSSAKDGGILLPTILTIAVLGLVSAIALNTMRPKYLLAFQTASWQESLLSAEAAVEVGINEVRRTVMDNPKIIADDPFLTTNGWTYFPDPEFSDLDNNGQLDPAEGETWNPATDDKNKNGIADALPNWTFKSALPHRTTEGVRDSNFLVTADVPLRHPYNREPYYRLRAWGQVDLPGGAVVAGEKPDNRLRMLSLRSDRRTGESVGDQPYARRYIEAVLKPVSAFRLAVFGVKKVSMTSHKILLDSWNSNDRVKYKDGLYPTEWNPIPTDAQLAALRQHNADVATNGEIVDASGARIYGDVATKGGSADKETAGFENVTGNVTNDFQQEVIPIRAPVVAGATDLGSITKEMVLTPGQGSVVTYTTSGISLQASDRLVFEGDATQDTYVQLIVDGKINVGGNGAAIVLGPRVFLRIFVTGDATIAGSGFINPNNALNLQIYGVNINPNGTPIDTSKKAVGEIKIAGSGGFKGAVYAPGHDVDLVGGGPNGAASDVFGSFTGRYVTMTGIRQIHYDEALSQGGLVVDYKIASWFEDVR